MACERGKAELPPPPQREEPWLPMPSRPRAEAPVVMERDGWERDAAEPVSRHQAVRGSEVAGMAMDQLSHRLPAADSVAERDTAPELRAAFHLPHRGWHRAESLSEVLKKKQDQNLL